LYDLSYYNVCWEQSSPPPSPILRKAQQKRSGSFLIDVIGVPGKIDFVVLRGNTVFMDKFEIKLIFSLPPWEGLREVFFIKSD